MGEHRETTEGELAAPEVAEVDAVEAEEVSFEGVAEVSATEAGGELG